MKVSSNTLTTCLLLVSNVQQVVAHPQPITDIQLVERTDNVREIFADGNALVKRKGGGGGGGKGGSGSSGKGGSGSSGSGSSSSGRGSSSSNTGGATKTGSGVQPNYGGGRYYGGGATTPYQSGVKSPLAGIVPILLLSTALTFWATAWLYGAYEYPYTHSYTFYNRTAPVNTTTSTTSGRSIEAAYLDIEVRQTTQTGMNQTKPVLCFCGLYAECGCDDNGNTTFLDSLIGDGTYANLNQSLVTVADVNGTSTILINGTLPNGTTASGGTESASAASRSVAEMSGYWLMVALVGGIVCLT